MKGSGGLESVRARGGLLLYNGPRGSSSVTMDGSASFGQCSALI